MKVLPVLLRWFSPAWLIVVIALLLTGAFSNFKLSSSIFALLPESDQAPLVQQATDTIARDFSSRLILLLSATDNDTVQKSVKRLAQRMSAMDDVASVDWQIEPDQRRQAARELFTYRFSVLSPDVIQHLQNGEFAYLSERALHRLYSLVSMGQTNLINDPFSLFTPELISGGAEFKIEVVDGLLKVVDTFPHTYAVVVELRANPYELAVQESILNAVQAEIIQSGVSIEQSGMLLHAEAGARQASWEISTIGLGSMLGIVILVLVVFRRPGALLLMLIPAAVGYACAVAVTALVFGEIHLVTLAFGAGLVGVSVDYSLHFLCERRICAANRILGRLLPGLMLGLFSSVMAYGAQALAPFPGLRQMAVFSVTGLIAAWITVVCWYPWLTRNQEQQPLMAAAWLKRSGARMLFLGNVKFITLILLCGIGLGLVSWNSAVSVDDIRLLQTSPKNLVEMEKRVREKLGIESSSQFILVQSASVEESLRREADILPWLEVLKSENLLSDFQALSTALPPRQKQQENQLLVSALYESQLDTLFKQLNLGEKVADARASFEAAKGQFLTWEIWQQTEMGRSWQNYVVKTAKGEVATVIRLAGLDDVRGREVLLSNIQHQPDLVFVDRSRDMTALMARYRMEISLWVVVAYLLVFLVLVTRYRQAVWRIMLPPAIASLMTLALLVQFEQGINLFHLMALILVLGIGLDMGIFMTETGGSSHTWLAVSMSCVTSLLAFGLLTWSNTPVLHHFGLTVLIGLGFVWLLVLIVQNQQHGQTQS